LPTPRCLFFLSAFLSPPVLPCCVSSFSFPRSGITEGAVWFLGAGFQTPSLPEVEERFRCSSYYFRYLLPIFERIFSSFTLLFRLSSIFLLAPLPPRHSFFSLASFLPHSFCVFPRFVFPPPRTSWLDRESSPTSPFFFMSWPLSLMDPFFLHDPYPSSV